MSLRIFIKYETESGRGSMHAGLKPLREAPLHVQMTSWNVGFEP